MDQTTSLVVDIDGTLCDLKTAEQTYLDVAPKASVIARLREYQAAGYHIILFTSRQMRTYTGNLGKINKFTAPITAEWLAKYQVPYDEIIFGKPWAGRGGYYVDDRAIRPSEFLAHSEAEIAELVAKERDVH
ncbi:MAG: capsular biosynthesis protein [Levilactobacillus sp.]|uniref:capsular biosynthesis protein n=1 Tax=Levilactobacillus sp. TaxID=2767919 RepID=UPI002584236D|nr:capsular biosynthesis protein [Levilactobacillus sp.]MCH4123097.1 capsular biosynthesis protein [Levilactobacillus sp.]MCI1552765.1 capsular biosynthesis protein [Levilactobacillus sp.]MCI1599591.1 capsular biosynthesis protein [Levilactobacillus sp.]